MKPKINVVQRGASLQRRKVITQETQQLEIQTKHMEDQLNILKTIMQQQKEKREVTTQIVQENGARWKAAVRTPGINNYAQNLLDEKRQKQQIALEKKKLLIRQQKRQASQQAIDKNEINHQQQSFNSTRQSNSGQSQRSVKLIPLNNRPQIEKIQAPLKITPKLTEGRPEEIEQFLKLMHLPQYLESILEHHNTLSALSTIKNSDLREMGVAPGHQIKIMKAIEQLKQMKTNASNVSIAESTPQKIKISKSKLIQLKQSTHIDEGKQQTHTVEQIFACQTESLMMRDCCWHCYDRNMTISKWIEAYSHQFCSVECLEKFKQTNEQTCNECGDQFSKGEGYLVYQVWFCTQQCSSRFTDKSQQQSYMSSHQSEGSFEGEESDSQEINVNLLQEDSEAFNEFLTQSLVGNQVKTLNQLNQIYVLKEQF